MLREVGHHASMTWKQLRPGDAVVPRHSSPWLVLEVQGMTITTLDLEDGRIEHTYTSDTSFTREVAVLRQGKDVNR